jgi:cytochrome c2
MLKVVATTILMAAFVLVVTVPAVAQGDPKVAKGKEVFAAQKCSMCHAIEGKGNKNMSLDGVGSKHTPDEIKKWIVSPKEMKADTKMKAYPSLTAEDLDALVTYLSSLKK